MEAKITAIYEKPLDHFSFSVSKFYEKEFLELIEENTDLSMIDFIKAEKRDYVQEGEERVEYKWMCADHSEEKIESFKKFAYAIYQIFFNAMKQNTN